MIHMEKRILIHAFNKGEVVNFYKGYYNEIEFVSKLGFCGSIDELYNYNYVQFYGNDGLIAHILKNTWVIWKRK